MTRDRGGYPVRLMLRTSSIFIFLIYSTTLIGCGGGHKAAADDVSNAPVAAVVKVTRGNISDNLEIASEFLPFQEVDVYAKVSGYIQKLYVDYGTHVKQGQILAVLEIPELQQQLQQDEASVRRSNQELARARGFESRASGVYRRAPQLHAARRRAEVAPGACCATGNRRRKGERSGSGCGRLFTEGRARRGRRGFAGRQGRTWQGSGHVRLRPHDGTIRRRHHTDLCL